MNNLNKKAKFKSGLIGGLSLISVVLSTALYANETNAVSQFDIESGSLKQALNQYMKQSGRQIVYFDEQIKGLNVKAVNGNLNNQAVLQQLLNGTGLVIKVDKSSGAVLIKKQTVVSSTTNNTTPVSTQTINSATVAEEPEFEVISITGSRIVGVVPTSPVITMTAEEMSARGIANIDQLVRYLPQNFSNGHSGGGLDGNVVASDAINSTTINLRGLGAGATLILINGKRIAASGATKGTYTDVSNIPFGAIERIEILTDGASAIYGSDAVAGVINFILKDDYAGYEISTRYENSSTGGDKFQLSLTGGFDWDSGNFTGSVSTIKSDPVDIRDIGIPLSAPEGRRGASDGIAGIVEPENEYRRNMPRMATPDSEQFSAHASFRQELTDDIELTGTVIYSKMESELHLLHDTSSFYYYPDGERATRALVFDYAFAREAAAGYVTPGHSENQNERYNAELSLDWVLPYKDWQLELSVSQGEDEVSKLSRELNPNVTDAFGNSGGLAATYDFVNLANNSAETYNSLYDIRDSGTRRGGQTTFSATLTGSLMELPAGELKFSAGGEKRTEFTDWTKYKLNPISPKFGDATTGINPSLDNFKPEVDSVSAYLELYSPLVSKDMSIPFVEYLALSFALRYDDYSFEGPFSALEPGKDAALEKRGYDNVVGKFGMLWDLNDEFSVNFNFGQAFQAPTLRELFEPVEDGIVSRGTYYIKDPYHPTDTENYLPYTEGEFLSGGNADLKPQTSTTTSLGLEYQSKAIDGLRVASTYTHTKVEDLIGDLYNLYASNPDYIFNPEIEHLFDFVERNDEGILTKFSPDLASNLGEQTSTSLDLDVTYEFGSKLGDFKIGLFTTHTLKLETQLPGLETVENVGFHAGPAETKARVYLDWFFGNWSANAKVNHDAEYKILADDGSGDVAKIDAYNTIDLQLAYNFDGWKLSGGVNNLLDEDFPFVAHNDAGFDTSRVDLRRRVIFLNVSRGFEF